MKPGLDVDSLLDDAVPNKPVEEKSFTGETFPQEGRAEPPTLVNATIPAVDALTKKSVANKPAQKTTQRQYVHFIDPRVCRAWQYHDRMEEALTHDRCIDLIDSIWKEGQKEPAIVRKLQGDDQYEYEIIYGRRRHFSCQHIRSHRDPEFTLKAIVKDINDDQEAAFLTWVENEGQLPITDFERAVYFRRLLGKVEGFRPVFKTQEELREKFELDKGKMSKLVKCGELIDYPDIMDVMPDRTEIPFTYGHKLAVALDDAKHKTRVIKHAKKLAGEGRALSTLQVIKHLMDSVTSTKKVEKPMVFQDKANNDVLSYQPKANGASHLTLSASASELSRRELQTVFNQLLDVLYSK